MSTIKSLLHERYELKTILGKGGQATVYRAFDRTLNVERAIKLLSKDLMRNNDARGRFEAEAQAMAKLKHPSIVRLYDIVSTNEFLFLVMDIIDGGNSWEWVRTYGKMPEKMACQAMLDVVDAVGALHQAGIIHRDIKPSNLLINNQGKLLITDFGIARFDRPDEQQTQTGVIMGTYGYMAPEQLASARLVTEQSDVYALGAALYALSTATVPKDLFMVQHKPALLRGVSEALQPVILRACAYEKEERFASTAELRQALVEAIPKLPPIPAETVSLKQQALNRAELPEQPINEQDLFSITWKNEVDPTFVFDTSISDEERTETNWAQMNEPTEVEPVPQTESKPSPESKPFKSSYVSIAIIAVLLLGIVYQLNTRSPLPSLKSTCQELAEHLVSQQKESGGFSGIVQAGASIWDSGQQFHALQSAKHCGVYYEEQWKKAITYLEQKEKIRHAIDLAWASLALSSPQNTSYLEQLAAHRLENGMYAFDAQDDVGDWYTTLLSLWAYCHSDEWTAEDRKQTLGVLISKMEDSWLPGLDEQLMWIRLEYGERYPELRPSKEELESLLERMVKRCGLENDTCTTIRWPDAQLASAKERFTLSFHGRPWALALFAKLKDDVRYKDDSRVESIFYWLVQKEFDSRGDLMGYESYRLSEHVFALGVYEQHIK